MSDHQALYRKYRPENFDQVLGQDHIVSVLAGQLKKEQTGHAYLFYGTRGLGKTTVARIFARGLGCAPEDVYEIDGASNRKIEHVRELRDAVRTLPMNSSYKVYIIDEVHMLTKEAFNALLKTLEEPPAHVVFILATTELEKLPDTIVSRCQMFTFRQPTQEILRDHLIAIAKKEGYVLSPDSANLIALLGDGSYRDAIGVLEKVMTYSEDKKLEPAEVARIVGAPTEELVRQILVAVAKGEASIALTAIRQASEQNVDMGLLVRMLLQTHRQVLLARFDQSERKRLQSTLTEANWKFVEDWHGVAGKNLNAASLSRLLEVVGQLRYSPIPALPLELAILDIIPDMGESSEA